MSRDGDLETIKTKCLETVKKRFGNDKKALVETVWELFGNVRTNPKTKKRLELETLAWKLETIKKTCAWKL